MYYIGLDVHWRRSSICILNQHGAIVKQKTLIGPWDHMIDELRQLDQPFALAYEASCGYGTLHDRLAGLPGARRIVVAHPGQLRLIFRAKRKNDRVDARKLALLLLLDQLPAVHVPVPDVRNWRRLIEYRTRLVNKRTRCKNGLRSLLRSHGVVMPHGLWTKRGRAWLTEVQLSGDDVTLERDLLLDELALLEQQVQRVTRALNERGRGHAGVMLLRTIPGVGPRTAEAVVAYLDDPRRFAHSKQVGAYFGLVPTQDASAAVNRLGHITREGPATVRRMLTEAAWQAQRLSPTVKAFGQRITGGKADRKKIAVVATAHYLLRCMYAMLRTGEAWREAA